MSVNDFKEDFARLFVDEKQFKLLMQPYRAAMDIVSCKLQALDDELHCLYEHSPIHHIKTRLKSPESIIEKLYRRNFPVTLEGVDMLQDIAGLRVVCKYVDDVEYISSLLLAQDDITLIRYSDYINNPKENGYRSYHLIVSVAVYGRFGKVEIPVEIQIRTIAMDMWASLEHNLRYKKHYQEQDEFMQRLKSCAEMLENVDLEMQEIYHQLNEKWQNKQ